MPVTIPTDVPHVDFADQDRERCTATGTIDEITRTLRRAGYTVQIKPCPAPEKS
jgi:hypothetical protein